MNAMTWLARRFCWGSNIPNRSAFAFLEQPIGMASIHGFSRIRKPPRCPQMTESWLRSRRYTRVAHMLPVQAMYKMTGRLLTLAALSVSLLGCATQPSSSDGRIPQPTRTAETICGNVIRLQKNQAEYQACVESLTESAGARRIKLSATSLLPADSGTESFFTASNALHRVREERACSLLGLGDDVEAFVRCVVTLDTNLFIATRSGA
jgi:hypothetical protein